MGLLPFFYNVSKKINNMISPTTVLNWFTQDKLMKILLALAISGAGIYTAYKAASAAEYNDLIIEYKEQAKESREALEACLEVRDKLLYENYALAQDRRATLSFQFDSPLPRWFKIIPCKNCQPVMRYMNNAYITTYLTALKKHIDDYEGKTDVQFWGEQVGKKYLEEDLRVIRTGNPIDEYSIDPFTNSKTLRVIKYPVRLPDGDIIGVGGVAIPPMKR